MDVVFKLQTETARETSDLNVNIFKQNYSLLKRQPPLKLLQQTNVIRGMDVRHDEKNDKLIQLYTHI